MEKSRERLMFLVRVISDAFEPVFDDEVADYKAQQFSIQMQEYARRFNAQRKKGEENGK